MRGNEPFQYIFSYKARFSWIYSTARRNYDIKAPTYTTQQRLLLNNRFQFENEVKICNNRSYLLSGECNKLIYSHGEPVESVPVLLVRNGCILLQKQLGC